MQPTTNHPAKHTQQLVSQHEYPAKPLINGQPTRTHPAKHTYQLVSQHEHTQPNHSSMVSQHEHTQPNHSSTGQPTRIPQPYHSSTGRHFFRYRLTLILSFSVKSSFSRRRYNQQPKDLRVPELLLRFHKSSNEVLGDAESVVDKHREYEYHERLKEQRESV
jgi:hypothetical protein